MSDRLPADIRGYHLRTKHAPTRYALGPAFLDWTSQPSPFRGFDGAPRIALPLRDRAPTPIFPGPAPEPAPLSRDALGLFLELAFGLSAWKSYEGSTWALRNNPSSGNLHPTEAYVLLGAVEGLGEAPALYHYAPLNHELEQRARYEKDGVSLGGGFLVGLGEVLWREAWKYGERAFRYCQLDAGHALGAAAQAAAALGWRAYLLPEPSDDEISALLGFDRADAWHRREEEHPEALLWIATDTVSPPSLDLRAFAQAPREWSGYANRLSEDHDGWPLIDLAARLCRKLPAPHAAAVARSPAQLPFPAPSIGEVVRGRRSAQRMDGVSRLSYEKFCATLAATLPGAAPLMPAFPFPTRVTLLLFVHRVDGVEPGLYLLSRAQELTERLRAVMSPAFDWTRLDMGGLEIYRLRAGSCEIEATKFSCLQPIAGKGCFAVAMIADFDRALAEQGGFGYRLLHWEAGLIGQVLYLFAGAAGRAGTGIGCFFDDEVHALLGLAPGQTQFQDVYHFTVGASVEDARLLSLPAYPDERRQTP